MCLAASARIPCSMKLVPKSRTAKAIFTAISHVLNMVTAFVVSLIVTPVLVKWLGLENYGAWVMAAQLIGYVALADLNPMNSLKLKLGIQQHLDNSQEKQQLIGASLIVALSLMPLFILLSFMAAYFAPLMVHASTLNYWDFQKAVFVLGANLSIAAFINLPVIVLRSANLEYKGMGVRSAGTVLIGVADIAVVFLNGGLTWLAINRLIYSMLIGAWHLKIAIHNVPWIGVGKPTLDAFRSILSISLWGTIGALSNIVGRNSDLLFIGVLFGPAISAMVSLTQTPVRVFCTYFYTLQGAMAGGAQDLIGRQAFERLTQIRYALHGMLLTLFVFSAVIMVWINEQFIHFWVGNGKYAGHTTNIFLIFIALAVLVSNLEGGTLAAFLKVKLWARVNLTVSILGTIVALLLGRFLGIYIFLIALLLFRTFQAVIYGRLVNIEMRVPSYRQDWWPAWTISIGSLVVAYYARTTFFAPLTYWGAIYGLLAAFGAAAIIFAWVIPSQARIQLYAFKNSLDLNRGFAR